MNRLKKDKTEQRRLGYAARKIQPDRCQASEAICARFLAMAEYRRAGTVMWYLNCRDEVKTRQALTTQLGCSKRFVIPFCTRDEQGRKVLGLWWLESLAELVPGTWGILEPPIERWNETGKRIPVEELDVIMVPGVAFDRRGGRLGNGAGYYDRLLAAVRPDTLLAGMCYETQLLDQICMETHDVYMNKVITDKAVYQGTRQC